MMATVDATSNDDHSKSLSWDGWNSNIKYFGLELQIPYAQYLLDGTKSIETRRYPLPHALLSKRIDVLESRKGVDGVSSIPDRVLLMPRTSVDDDALPSTATTMLHRKGWCTFTHCFRYTTREQFEADAHKHLVDAASGYGWNDARPMYGWVVGSYGLYDNNDDKEKKEDDGVEYIAERRMRSLFEIMENRRSE
jgi:hypothetical protein